MEEVRWRYVWRCKWRSSQHRHEFEELLDVHIHLCFNNTIACPYKNVVMKKTMLLVGLDLCSTFLNTLSVFTLCDLTRILCKGEM